MTVVSNDPSWWPFINLFRVTSYFAVASFIVVVYDWALTFGQELDLIWKYHERWSLMTILYLGVRYLGILYSILQLPSSLLSVSMSDIGCSILGLILWWMSVVINAMLGVIMITRLYAMYQRSRRVLIFLIIIFLAVTITCVVIAAKGTSYAIGEEVVLSGTYQCVNEGNEQLVAEETWILGTVWEVLALFLAVWVVVKHFRELWRSSTGQTLGDCFAVLIQTHSLYFATFAAGSCFNLIFLAPKIFNSTSVGNEVLYGVRVLASAAQMFVLGPRLILSVREFHVKLVADSDAGVGMTTIEFQADAHGTSGGDV